MGSCDGVRRQLLSLVLASLFLLPLLPPVGSDTPPGSPYYVYGFVEDENGPVASTTVNLTLSSGGSAVAWNETTTDGDGFYKKNRILWDGNQWLPQRMENWVGFVQSFILSRLLVYSMVLYG